MASLSGAARTIIHRTIIHVDLDAFYCAVEEQRDPSLRGRAFAVGARAQDRGVVASCSYPARRCGVRSAMAMGLAQRLCPHLLVVPTRHATYRAVSAQVMDLLRSFTPQLEQLSIDEAFLDVTELVANNPALTGRSLALEIQRRVFEELGLSCSLGVASNKMVAKIATDCGKASVATGHSPQALCVVEPGREAEFLAPLPVSALWGVGPKLESRLKDLGIETIGALSKWPERDLMRRFGRHGADLSQHARGIDKREIVTERESKSISSETTFVQDVQEWEHLHEALQEQAQSVAKELQEQKLQATTVKIKLRWSDFSFSTRQTTLLSSTDAAPVIEEAATALLTRLWVGAEPVRLLGVGVSGLSTVRQLGLFDDNPDRDITTHEEPPTPKVIAHTEAEIGAHERRHQRLREAVALLEARFGSDVVHLGARKNERSL
ncbi:MAG: DNA polymerase IV [Armatimonadetes bacterium]|nr:DNA polymerase IV [Armatimonadota bacterium]